MIDGELYSFFSQHPSFYGLIGDSSSFRFYPDFAPGEAITPFVVYSSLHLSGGLILSGDDGTREERIRFNVAGKSLLPIFAILKEIEKLLHGKLLTMGQCCNVVPILISGSSVYDEDPKIFRRIVDYKFTYSKGE